LQRKSFFAAQRQKRLERKARPRRRRGHAHEIFGFYAFILPAALNFFPKSYIFQSMKFLIASDIHGALAQTKKILAAFEAEKTDYLLLGGDYLNHGPRNSLPDYYAPEKTAELLNCYANKIIGIRGNCDSEVDQMLLKFPMMGDYALIFLEGRRCFLTHGHLYSPETLAWQETCPQLPNGSVFISGHTHTPVLEYSEGILLLNPGSPSIPKGGSKAGYALLSGESAVLKTLEGEKLKEIHFG
jgi:putative phosphoesterase